MQKLQPFLPIQDEISLAGDIQIHEGKINLKFEWLDPKHRIHFPDHLKLERLNELWQSTCFEVFLQAEHAHDYYEVNLSPGGAWNAYHFHHYRTPHPPEPTKDIQLLSFHRHKGLVEASFQLRVASHIWRCGLTAVVELLDGHKVYFATDHTGERPDFHLNESFKLRRVAT